MSRILLCSTPRVGSVSYAEKLRSLLQLPLAFQPWEAYAFDKQPTAVKDETLRHVNSNHVLIHSHIHACSDQFDSMDLIIYIGRKNRIKQAWSFFVAHYFNKMQNLDIKNITVPEPSKELVNAFINWINLWDRYSYNKHRVFYEDLDLNNSKWFQCKYENINIENFDTIENRIQNECESLL